MKSSRGLTRNPLRVYVEYDLVDRDGRVVRRGRQLSHSFLVPWIKYLSRFLYTTSGTNPPTTSVIDVTGTSRTIPCTASYPFYYHVPGFWATIGQSDRGIVVGSGSTPNSSSTYKLDSQISHGTSAGQLQYGDESVTDVTEVSPGVFEAVLSRPFTNVGGVDVVVRECGIYALMHDTGANMRFVCVLRDLLNPPDGVTVPDSYGIIIKYRFRITIS